jgi:alpha-glucosidase
MSSQVQIQQVYMPQLDRERTLRIYLPPGYADSDARYPVIYMQDGQNLFDAKDSYNGTIWRVKDNLDALANQAEAPKFIVVGIDNGGEQRLTEYGPWPFEVEEGKSEGQGAQYAEFLATTLKAYIDAYYRTKPEREHTALMGSSMGGLISFYTGLSYQHIFSKIVAFSPTFAEHVVGPNLETFVADNPQVHQMRIWLDMGDEEPGDHLIPRTNAAYDWLLAHGFPAEHCKKEIVQGGRHAEDSWADRYLRVISWLYQFPLS